jgi:hypothetical protein
MPRNKEKCYNAVMETAKVLSSFLFEQDCEALTFCKKEDIAILREAIEALKRTANNIKK